MSDYQGDFTAGKTIRVCFNTQDTAGAPITLASGTLSVYKDGSLTESTTGVTLSTDFDGRTGLHQGVVDTSADGTFYSAGSDFEIVITVGTVNAISVVGKSVGKFSLSNRSALRPTVADRDLDVSATGEAGLDWANVGSPTTAVNLSATNIDTDQVVASVGSVASGGITAASFAADAIDATALATSAVGEIADGVWDELIAGHLGAGSTGAALNAAGSAGDPWTTPLPGAYGAGTAGFIVGTNLDSILSDVEADTQNIQSRLPAALIAGRMDSNTQATAATLTFGLTGNITGNLSGSVGSVTGSTGSVTNTDAIADAVLNRDFAAVADTNTRSALNALRFLRNKWDVAGVTLTVFLEDDSTPAWTAAISTDAAAIPIIGSDPA